MSELRVYVGRSGIVHIPHDFTTAEMDLAERLISEQANAPFAICIDEYPAAFLFSEENVRNLPGFGRDTSAHKGELVVIDDIIFIHTERKGGPHPGRKPYEALRNSRW